MRHILILYTTKCLPMFLSQYQGTHAESSLVGADAFLSSFLLIIPNLRTVDGIHKEKCFLSFWADNLELTKMYYHTLRIFTGITPETKSTLIQITDRIYRIAQRLSNLHA